ncbi:MAG: serine/threonine protein kinase, partial [Pseudomonas sp.]|nr:serine/threonine protein kinase [Pseudomonas sp.]
YSPEDVAANFAQICDFEGASHPKDNIEALQGMMANLQKFAL